MPIDLNSYSRFAQTETVIAEESEVFSRWVVPDILTRQLAEGDIIRFVVEKRLEGRPDKISLKLYGTTHLDWLLIAFNNASGALNWPRAGDVIKAPNPSIAIGELV